MLVVIAEQQILSPQQVCQGCLMSDRSGRPRWQNSKLRCGKAMKSDIARQAQVYECQMGFNITWID